MQRHRRRGSGGEPSDVSDDPTITSFRARRSSVPLARMLSITLWVLVVSGVVLGAAGFARPAQRSQAAPAPGAPTRWDVAGFAEMFVASFLTAGEGSEATLAPFLGERPPALTGVTPGSWYVSRTTAVAVEELERNRWRVTVGADLLQADPESGGFAGRGVRFFAVVVSDNGGGLVAGGLPGIVAGPAAGSSVEDGWGSGAPPTPGDVLADTVARFLAALVKGTGDISRYAAPGSGLRAAAATFETVTVDRIAVKGTGERRRVRAWVTGTSGRAVMPLVYDLVLVERSGRWEIAAIGDPPASPPTVTPAVVSSSSSSGG